MAQTNYPFGFSHGLSVRGVPVLNSHAGNIWWVDSGIGSNNYSGKTKEKPFATIDYAIGRCTASNGDIILVAPGHAETITASNTMTFDVAGVSVVGLGVGSARPTITVGTDAAATVTISAANVSIENVVFKAALDGLNTTLTVSGAGCYLDIEHQDTSATVEADIAITCTGDQFTCKLRDIGFTGGDQRDQSITLNAVDNARIDIDFYGKVATAVVDFITAACTDVEVRGTMYVSGTTNGSKNVVDTITGSTWYMDVVDAAAGARYTGGSGAAVASDDISKVSSDLVIVQSDLKIVQSDLKGANSDVKIMISDLKIVQSDLKGANSDVKIMVSDLKIVQSDLKGANSDVKIMVSDLKIVQSDLKGANSDVKIMISDLKIVQSDLKGCNSDMKILISDWLIFFAKYKSDNP